MVFILRQSSLFLGSQLHFETVVFIFRQSITMSNYSFIFRQQPFFLNSFLHFLTPVVFIFRQETSSFLDSQCQCHDIPIIWHWFISFSCDSCVFISFNSHFYHSWLIRNKTTWFFLHCQGWMLVTLNNSLHPFLLNAVFSRGLDLWIDSESSDIASQLPILPLSFSLCLHICPCKRSHQETSEEEPWREETREGF